MANPERGEVDLVVNGETYTLRLPMPRLIALEQEFGREALFDRWIPGGEASLTEVRGIFVQAFQEHHRSLDASKVGELMNDMTNHQLGLWRNLIWGAFRSSRHLLPKEVIDENWKPDLKEMRKLIRELRGTGAIS